MKDNSQELGIELGANGEIRQYIARPQTLTFLSDVDVLGVLIKFSELV